MFGTGLGFFEIVVICGIALIALGPERVPGATRKLAQWLGEIRRTADGFKREIMMDHHDAIWSEPEGTRVSRQAFQTPETKTADPSDIHTDSSLHYDESASQELSRANTVSSGQADGARVESDGLHGELPLREEPS